LQGTKKYTYICIAYYSAKDSIIKIKGRILMNVENAKAQMRKGVLEYCILSILSDKDAYASDVINKLKDARMIVVDSVPVADPA
jgi:hypothetical protein